MMRQTREKDLALFVGMSEMERPKTPQDVPLPVLIPLLSISELKTAFFIGFVLYVPFSDHRYGGGERASEHGHDDAPADSDFFALQTHALCPGGRVAPRRGIHGEELWRRMIMTPEFVVGFAQEAIKTTIIVSMPLLGLGLAVGLVVSIFQAVTQIHEMTLTFVPKILVVLLALLFFAGWMLDRLIHFAGTTIEQIPTFIR
jgi:flagellar biosynthesis protein FliQ